MPSPTAENGALVQEGSQFVISTHSPIILAYPDTTIYQCTD